MIIVKITGGLGNQLFQYAIGRALSLRLDCELALDISFYPKQTLRKYELDKFNIKATIASDSEITNYGGGSRFIDRLMRRLKLTPYIYPNYIKELESFTYVKSIDTCKVDSYLDGYWQNPNYFDHIKTILCEDFTPVTSISQQANEWLLEINSSKSVSVHIRRGDYVNNSHTNSVHGVCSIDYYKKAIEHIQQEIDNPIFYVFSDDINWCKENLSFIENINYIDNTKSAIDDLILMSNCSSNIIANSTFSWWGAWMNLSNNSTIAPNDWFVEMPIKEMNFLPQDWIVLK